MNKKLLLKHHLPHVVVHIGLAIALVIALGVSSVSLLELSKQAKAPRVSVNVVSGHICDSRDSVMQCHLPQSSLGNIEFGLDPTPLQGVDFGWSCPVTQAKSFGASYLSYDSSKDWTQSCINTFHSQHKGTVAVWEAGANDAEGGYSLGFKQAQQASQELRALGAPSNQPFDMAIDCDCAGSALIGYFQGANKAEPGRINAYGGYNQVKYLYDRHLVGHLNWQTYAWSGGQWLPASVAPLEQYLNSSSVDYDRSIAPNYGQWPFNSPKPGPVCFGKHWQRTSFCNKIRHQDAVLGKTVKKEQAYLKVSNSNLVKINKQIQALLKQRSGISNHAKIEANKIKSENTKLESSLHQYGYRKR